LTDRGTDDVNTGMEKKDSIGYHSANKDVLSGGVDKEKKGASGENAKSKKTARLSFDSSYAITDWRFEDSRQGGRREAKVKLKDPR